jgi:hypothetical protein
MVSKMSVMNHGLSGQQLCQEPLTSFERYFKYRSWYIFNTKMSEKLALISIFCEWIPTIANPIMEQISANSGEAKVAFTVLGAFALMKMNQFHAQEQMENRLYDVFTRFCRDWMWEPVVYT